MTAPAPTDPLRGVDLSPQPARGVCLGAPSRAQPFQRPGRSAVYATRGMCATSHPLAAAAAVEMLRQGGNAVDAGVAAAFVLSVAEPMMTGLGGDAFAIYAKPDGAVIGLDGAGRAPAALDPDKLRAEEGAAIGLGSVNAVTIPGAVATLCRLQERHGRFDLARVLAPARAAAEDGVPVAPRTAFDWARNAPRLRGAARRFYLRPDGAPYAVGDLFRAPGLAEALALIARDGAAGFYRGPVGADLLASLTALGGAHRPEDFADVEPEDAAPIGTVYRGQELLELPPSGQGLIALTTLDMLSGFDVGRLDPLGAERAHLEIEALKLAYDARDRFLSEPGGGDGGVARLRDAGRIRQLAALIDLDRARPRARIAEATAAVHRDTVYLCAVDADGGALSLIVSLFHGFGSGLASERYGLLFHNRGAGFTLARGHPNEAGGGKRPLHTLCPGMLRRDGKAVMPFGVMGGQYQAAGHARLVSNLLDCGLDLQAALDAPRLFPEGASVELESGYAPLTLEALSGKGHTLRPAERPIGGAQAIWIDHARGVLCGASDPRKDGAALGF